MLDTNAYHFEALQEINTSVMSKTMSRTTNLTRNLKRIGTQPSYTLFNCLMIMENILLAGNGLIV